MLFHNDMKVLCTNFFINNVSFDNVNKHNQKRFDVNPIDKMPSFYYPVISFQGHKTINFEEDKQRIIKSIDSILSMQDTEIQPNKNIVSENISNFLKSDKEQKFKSILLRYQFIKDNRMMSLQQKKDSLLSLRKELKSIDKKERQSQYKQLNITPKISDEKIDYVLFSKFKSAILQDNYDLNEVFTNHYAQIADLKSVDELVKQYPKIKIPLKPSEIVAKKIENNLTKDFYEDLDKLCVAANDGRKIKTFVSLKSKEVVDAYAIEFNLPKNSLQSLSTELSKIVTKRYKDIVANDSFSSIPEFRKQKFANLSKDDIRLLGVDYDDFVLQVVSKQYVGMQNLNQIIYYDKNSEISINSINDSCYKFKKVSEKAKSVIISANNLKQNIRNYDNYTTEQFLSRLDYYSMRTDLIDDKSKVWNKLLIFSDCSFEKEDIAPLKLLLREIDAVADGNKSFEELESEISKNSKLYSPHGTIKIKEDELQRIAKLKKDENKQLARLQYEQNRFDDVIMLLYGIDGLSQLATTYANKYRPTDLEHLENSHKFIDIVMCNYQNGKLINEDKICSDLERWNLFVEKFQESQNDELVIEALEFADGDQVKAGQYLLNYIRESKDDFYDPDLFELVMDRCGGDKKLAVKYLCKYDNYFELDEQEKNKLSVILSIFSPNSDIDKSIIKYIIDNYYINTDTIVDIENSKRKSIFEQVAKQAIVQQYKFPLCVQYLSKFEDAMSHFADKHATSGIKQVGLNNDVLKGSWEAKIKGAPDRVIAYEENEPELYFAEYIKEGLH